MARILTGTTWATVAWLAIASSPAPVGAATGLNFLEAEFDGVGGVDGLDGAHAVAVSPDGAFVYVASMTDDAIAVFARDGAGHLGTTTFVQAVFDGVGGVDGLDGVEHLVLDASGSHLYAAGLLDNAVAVFARDAGTGALSFVEVERDGVGGVNGLAGASWVAVAPDGAHVYVAGRFDDAVAVFARNASTGALTFLQVAIDGASGVDGLADVTAVAVAPDGDNVYAAGVGDHLLATFARALDGTLLFLGTVADGLPNPEVDIDDHHGLAIAPDGGHLYVSNHVELSADGWLATFAISPATGLLTQVGTAVLGDAVDICFLGIEGDAGIAVSPNGSLVFATLPWNSALAVFERDPATGVLTLFRAVCDETIGMGSGGGAVDGLWSATGVAVSPDGRNAYTAAGNIEDALAAFADVAFADGFESGDTAAWSVAVP